MSGFEEAFGGSDDGSRDQAEGVCQICWTPLDPVAADGLAVRVPGASLDDLPPDWTCPTCNASKEAFVAPAPALPADAERAAAVLVADFDAVLRTKMRNVPLVNIVLRVEATGFRIHDGRPVGALITPWFMSLVVLPSQNDTWTALEPGTKEYLPFPSGNYEFLHNVRPGVGGYKACCLFSPMHEFSSQDQARKVAEVALDALFAADAADHEAGKGDATLATDTAVNEARANGTTGSRVGEV
ncbi:MAG: [NiFe]-hydrogenase assembly chaperone HybE [Pseudomonadota bacterium]